MVASEKKTWKELIHLTLAIAHRLSPTPSLPTVAVDRLPNFLADPNESETEPMPHHRCTIHINSETTACLERAYRDAAAGRPSDRSGAPHWGHRSQKGLRSITQREAEFVVQLFFCFVFVGLIKALQLPIRTIITGQKDAG